MCGISGIINKNGSKVDKNYIQKINDLISHRGPDDEGFYFEKNFAFGHRRLSILDLSRDGHQPMHYLEKYVITYNGEVYNYLEIKEELIKYGYVFNSHTDTEVILASYDKWKEECVNRFNGMWAFAIYDKQEDKIFCSRDRFGVKPFYYTQVGDKFIFGSEIKQLLEFYEEVYVNKQTLIDFIVTSFQEHTEGTFFESIYKLRASHNLIYDLKTNSLEIKKYYNINFTENQNSLDEAVQNYEIQFNRAVDYRLRSDVKVGTCLSGGLDSSSVATIAGKKYFEKTKEKFIAIHAKSIDKDVDESHYAKIVSEYANLNLQIVEPNIEEFKNNIDEVVYTQEEPFGSPSIFMQYFVMKKAKEIGCTVMLDGQGGDETLLGYEKYYPSAYIDIYRHVGFFNVLKEIRKSNKNNSKMSVKWILKYTIGSLFANLRKIEYKRRTSFLKPYSNSFLFLNELAKRYLNVNRLQEYEIESTNLPVLLRYEDKNSMRHSIETRLPFIDYITLENALNVNMKYKVKDGWTKYILRKMIDKYLPKEVVWRKNKLGFNAPESSWLNAINEQMKLDIIDSTLLNSISDIEKLSKCFYSLDKRLQWRLYNVAVWERVYNIKTK
ncbi:MAG: asparagine synthase (glutamine-hydrolyzing) [Bacteroidetes bacterium]|nr:asparagine synthase (glutamine-hydrolyzing) [Bacteroidota bacterium]